MKSSVITPQEFAEAQQRGDPRALIDVRTPGEFGEVHAQNAVLFPLDSLDPAQLLASGTLRSDEPIAVICKSGNRSATGRQKLESAGFTDVVHIEGGTQAWEKAGLPVVRGKKSVSLERQVRIAAGSLVVVGLALGRFFHPSFYLLSAFVGGGLVFSGLTDTCGMGMLLAKMPWNRA